MFRVTKVQNSPLFRGILLWNQLPADVQTLDKLSLFKNAIRSLLDNGNIQFGKGRAKQ